MSTRRTIWLPFDCLHLFEDVIFHGVYIDIGRSSYNHAYRIWPPTLLVRKRTGWERLY